MIGGFGDDRLHGGADEGGGALVGDILAPGPGDDVVRPGFDRRQLRPMLDLESSRRPDALVFYARKGVEVRLGDPHRWGTVQGEGRDRIRGQRVMWVIGTPGDDVLVGGNGDETFTSRSGRDQVWGLAGDDVLYDDGDDVLHDDSDTKDGGPGDDRIFTSSGADQMVGGTGDDYLFSHVETCAAVDGGVGTDELEVYDIEGLLTFDGATGAASGSAGEPACGSATSYESLTIDSRDDTGVVYTGTDGPDHVTVLDHGAGVVADLLAGDDW